MPSNSRLKSAFSGLTKGTFSYEKSIISGNAETSGRVGRSNIERKTKESKIKLRALGN